MEHNKAAAGVNWVRTGSRSRFNWPQLKAHTVLGRAPANPFRPCFPCAKLQVCYVSSPFSPSCFALGNNAALSDLNYFKGVFASYSGHLLTINTPHAVFFLLADEKAAENPPNLVHNGN